MTSLEMGSEEMAALPRAREGGSILHFIDTTGPGGAETIYLQVAAGMRDRGWSGRSVVVGPGWVLNRLQSMALPFDLVATRRRFDVTYLWQLHTLVRRHRIQLIHAHLYSPSVYASLIGALHGIPVIATFHGASDVEQSGTIASRLRERLIDKRAEVVCVSEALASAVCASTPKRYHRPLVIYNGVDTPRFRTAEGSRVRREMGIPDDSFLVGSLGNLRPAKDYPTLLHAAAKLESERQLRFAIVGEQTEPLFGELVQLRNELGLEERVSFWGFRQDIPEVVAAFDALAISSSSEGFSLAAVQAMAAGKPVVATQCGGPEEIITDGVDGLLVPRSSPDALASALRLLSESPVLCVELGSAASHTASKRFSLEAMVDAYERLYLERIIGSGGLGRSEVQKDLAIRPNGGKCYL